jgi:hypothetical protein
VEDIHENRFSAKEIRLELLSVGTAPERPPSHPLKTETQLEIRKAIRLCLREFGRSQST